VVHLSNHVVYSSTSGLAGAPRILPSDGNTLHSCNIDFFKSALAKMNALKFRSRELGIKFTCRFELVKVFNISRKVSLHVNEKTKSHISYAV